MNMLDLPCVSIGAAMAKRHNVTDKSALPAPRAEINDLVVALSVIKPLWTFSLVCAYYVKDYGFEVYENGENLGKVEWSYFRRDYGFVIENQRIAKGKVRTSSHKTSDPKKALAVIKKMFYRQNFNERFDVATAAIDKLVGNESYEKSRKASAIKRDLDIRALEFAYSIQDEFKEFLKVKGKHHLWETHQVANLEMLTIEEAKKEYNKRNAAIVLRADGQYIVKLRDKVEIMDDTTLPSWLKAKLGMLKLVEDDHFVSDIGCRVNAECFMVLAKQDEEQI